MRAVIFSAPAMRAPGGRRRRPEYRWNRRRLGVSDILATILLVAIVVVLATVLYVLDTALVHGPGSLPIGSAFAAGTASAPTPCTAVGAPMVGCIAAGDFVYVVTIAQSTVTFGSVLFEVKSPVGTFYRATGDGGFNILNVAGQTDAAYNLSASGPLVVPGVLSWHYFAGTGVSQYTPLTTVYSIVVDMGSLSPSGQGDLFVAAGTGSYTGTTAGFVLP